MLGKELKIKTLKKQREFIKNQIMNSARDDGNPDYRYVGQVFPEVIEYFQNEGFEVNCFDSVSIRANFSGRPIYYFSVSDDVKLSEEELAEAEVVGVNTEEEGPDSMLGSIFDDLFRGRDRQD